MSRFVTISISNERAALISRDLGARDRHAGAGHRTHDSQHAAGRAACRCVHRPRRLHRPGPVDRRGERGDHCAPPRLRACVSRRQARRSRVPRPPRRADAGARAAPLTESAPGGEAQRRAVAAHRLSAGSRIQSRQPEDGRLLHEPPAAVRARVGPAFRRLSRARSLLLCADHRVADRLRVRRRACEGRLPAAAHSPVRGRAHRCGARRAGLRVASGER